MKFTKISILAIVLFSFSIAQAQYVIDYRKKGDEAYERKDWQTAATNYENYLNKKKAPAVPSSEKNPYAVEPTPANKVAAKQTKSVPPTDVAVKLLNYRIAESYRQLFNYKAAEPWYAKVVAIDKASYPTAQYHYAVCLSALGKHNEAETQLKEFLENYKTDDELSRKAKTDLKNLQFVIAQMKSRERELYQVNKMQAGVNTTSHGQNTAPYVSNKTLYFTSSRPDTVSVKKTKKVQYKNRLFANDNAGTNPANFPSVIGVHQGAFTFTPDGKTTYFTRWAEGDMDAKSAAIYKSTQNADGTWAEATKLGTDINAEGYTSKDPMLTADGKYLLFASTKPGGQGGFDIWYASVDGDKIGTSTNMGTPINTEANEISPFYHTPSMQLVFANKGRVGMGGYDLYSSKGSIGSSFGEPKDLGYPVNSIKNDQYFFSNDDKFLLRNFYLSSDRDNDCCLELFTANKLIKKWISGKVVDAKTGKPLSDVVINSSADSKALPQARTDANGNYMLMSDPYSSVSASAHKDGYEPSAQRFDNTDFNVDTLIRNDWALTPIPPPPPPVITDSTPLIVRFDFNRANILDEYKYSLDTLAAMMARDPNMVVEIGGHTDGFGSVSYNLNLGKERADSAKLFMVQTYGTDANRLITKAYGKCCPLVKETNADGSDNAEARSINRRLEFKMLKRTK